MSSRFAPELWELRKVLDRLQISLTGAVDNADRLWIEALSAVNGSDLKSLTATDVHNILFTIRTGSGGIPWQFYDILSELIKHVPTFIKDIIINDIKIQTGYQYEFLQIGSDGNWQVVWLVNPDESVADYREVALDWYIPPNRKKAPMVPLAILDHIASCVLLLQSNLVLPAASVLSVVLEAALWDALEAKNMLQKREEITYSSVKWHFKQKYDRFLVGIEGADKNVKDLTIPTELAGNSPNEMTLRLRRTHIENSDKTVDLLLSVDKDIVNYLASEQVADRKELKTRRGLSAAIQRARNADLECIRFILPIYDQTFIALRNSLIHLPSRGDLDEPIPIPGNGELKTTDDLRDKKLFINQLLYHVCNIIRSVYGPDNK